MIGRHTTKKKCEFTMGKNSPTVDPVLQSLFDTMVNGIKKQGCLSWMTVTIGMNSLPMCYYRHPQDSSIRCVLGHLIPDEMYKPEMENQNAIGILQDYPDLVKHLFIDPYGDYSITGLENPRAKLLRDMQRAHDQSDSVQEFLSKAAKVAKEFNLNDKVTQ